MANAGPEISPQEKIGRQLLGPLDDALGLVRRYRQTEDFQDYVGARLALVIPAGLLLAVAAIACAMTPIMLLVGTRPVAALAGLLIAPVVLAGSLFVLGYVFFAWLEERALARSLGHRTAPAPSRLARWLKRKLGADLGKAPRVPWLLAAIFVILPLAILAYQAPSVAAPLLLLLAAMPVLYARLER